MSLVGTTNDFGKDIWLEGLYEQYLTSPGQFYNMLADSDPERIEGRNAYFKVKTGNSLGGGVIDEDGDFHQPIDPTHDEARLTMSTLDHTVKLTLKEYEDLNSGRAAAVPVVQYKLGEALEQFKRDIARMCLMDGEGVLARCTTTSGATAVNILTSNGDSGSANQYDRDAFNWLASNQAYIDIVSSSTGAAISNGSGRKVTSVNKSSGIVNIADGGGNVTTSTSHYITWSGNVVNFSSGSYTSGEFPGVNAILQKDRTYLGINSNTAGNEFWDGTVVGAEDRGGTAGTNKLISLDDLMTLITEMAQYASDGMQPTAEGGYCLFSNYGPQNAAVEYLAGSVSYVNPTAGERYDFGGTKATFGGMEWYADVRYPRNVIDCLHKPSLKRVRPTNEVVPMFNFIPGPINGIWNLQNASSGTGHSAAYRAYLYAQVGMMTPKPAAHGRLDDVKEKGVI